MLVTIILYKHIEKEHLQRATIKRIDRLLFFLTVLILLILFSSMFSFSALALAFRFHQQALLANYRTEDAYCYVKKISYRNCRSNHLFVVCVATNYINILFACISITKKLKNCIDTRLQHSMTRQLSGAFCLLTLSNLLRFSHFIKLSNVKIIYFHKLYDKNIFVTWIITKIFVLLTSKNF